MSNDNKNSAVNIAVETENRLFNMRVNYLIIKYAWIHVNNDKDCSVSKLYEYMNITDSDYCYCVQGSSIYYVKNKFCYSMDTMDRMDRIKK